MTNVAYTRLKPQILVGRRILLTAFVTPHDDYFEPPDGWIEPVEVALYGSRTGCSLSTATGEKRYVDSYGRDELIWNNHSFLQNVQLRQEWGLIVPQTLDLSRLQLLVTGFIKACTVIYRHNHPPIMLGTAIIPAGGLQIFDLATGMGLGPLSTSSRVVAQTALADGAITCIMETLQHGLQTVDQK